MPLASEGTLQMPGPAALGPAWVSLSAALPLPVCKRRNKCSSSSSLSQVFKKSSCSGHQQVPCFVWPTSCTQRRAPGGRTVLADLSPRAPGAWGLAIQAAPRAHSAVIRTALPDKPWPEVCRHWAAPVGRKGRAAPRRAHPAGRTAQGARSSEQSAFNTMDRSRDRGARPARQPAPRASSRPPQRRLLPGVSTRQPPDVPFPRRLRLTSSASRVAPVTYCPGAKKMQQAPRKTAASALQNIPPSPTT